MPRDDQSPQSLRDYLSHVTPEQQQQPQQPVTPPAAPFNPVIQPQQFQGQQMSSPTPAPFNFAGATQAPAAPAQQTWSFLGSGTGSRAQPSEALSRMIKKFTDELPGLVQDYSDRVFELAPVDRAHYTDLVFSAITMVSWLKASPDTKYHYFYIVEESGELPTARTIPYNGTNFEVQRTPSDAYNQRFVDILGSAIAKRFGASNFTCCEGMVIPKRFNTEDKGAIHTALTNGIVALMVSQLPTTPGYVPRNLAYRDRDSVLELALKYNQPPSADASGLPVRSGVVLQLSASAMGSRSGNDPFTDLNNGERRRVIGNVSGYIDASWAGRGDQQMMPGMYGYMPMVQPFIQRFVATAMENVWDTTLESQLLVLAATTALSEMGNYLPYYDRHGTGFGSGKNRVDISEPGALNIEGRTEDPTSGGWGAFIETRSAAFSQQELSLYLAKIFRPGMLLSLRVSDCGADSWYNSPFRAAANGDPAAIDRILRAADNLTNGNFSRIHTTGRSPLLPQPERVHLGYYIDEDGIKRDIAEIDYTAVMNLVGRQNPSAGAEWGNTFTQALIPSAVRLAMRRNMLENLLHTEVTYTGSGLLTTFDPSFLQSLTSAIASTGLDIRSVNTSVSADYLARGNYAHMAQSVLMPGQTGLFRPTYGAPAGQQWPQQQVWNGAMWPTR